MKKQDRQLSEYWDDLQEAGEVPEEGTGKTAERAKRDEKRKTPRYPSEDDRVGRKISPTLSSALIRRLRTICKAEGYVNPDGEGQIASNVLEDLLWYAVEAYDRGDLESEEVVITTVKKRLRPKD